MLPVYVINLDRRPDRWAAMTAQLDRLGLEAVRIPAVDAQTVTDEELRQRVNLDNQIVRMGRGSEATVLSHCRALEAFLAGSDPAALFLQDDVELAVDLPAFLRRMEWWPDDCGLVHMEAQSKAKRRYFSEEIALRYQGRQFRHILTWAPGAAAFMADRATARTVLDNCVDLRMAIDIFLFNLRLSRMARQLRPVQILPALARQRGDILGSDIRSLKEAAPWSVQAKLRRDLLSFPRKVLVAGSWASGRGARIPLQFVDRC